ncbi:MAG: hypothetical protein ABH882_01215 [Candidatus Omnitrophota bacterium]|nr:hypothetical protein [Candidatus Omnitrophota bacterium]MBU1929509.1 hypothetical protein [Candidatus Omnitrophota bacterium]MBU2035306.1 hypothetical protein [Candidatus Omnitrophota bacterium]MBU2221294.1 hypothetical protein [Candidatus Omnitrophota bacterium]MBU2258462.1 hypothetical protein [Candidatus Omnitrophota bacterium]
MNKKHIIFVLIIAVLLCGCDKFAVKNGKAGFIIPFDFPQNKTSMDKIK